MTPNDKISVKTLRDYLVYDPTTGSLLWSKRTLSGTHSVGSPAGTIIRSGYRRVGLNNTSVLAHRAALAIYYGHYPTDCLDHINGDRSDNRISNLRIADRFQNRANSKRSKNNRSGFAGVRKSGGKWIARLKQEYLGTFQTPEEASAAYKAAALLTFGTFAFQGRQ